MDDIRPEIADVLRTGWGLSVQSIHALGDGHIHATYRVCTDAGDRVLQRFNHQVFVDPPGVMANIARVQQHLRARLPLILPVWYPTLDQQALCRFQDSWWRLGEYVANARTLTAATPAQARVAGSLFARWHEALADLPGPKITEPIRGFLQLGHYLAQWDALQLQTEFDTVIDTHRALAGRFAQRNACLHGDCKIDNLLFAADSDDVVAVLDLDTAMWGHWAWDFGDLARSLCAQGARFSMPLFGALCEGYLSCRPALASAQTDLRLAPRYVGIMLALRFLTDHYRGDVYFRVSHRGENLERARRQFALLETMPQM